MNRAAIKLHNKKVIKQVRELISIKLNAPYRLKIRMGYKELAANLNKYNLLSSRGNQWTMRSLYRMMQRQGVAICTIQKRYKKAHLKT